MEQEHCLHCGKALRPGAAFCEYCGTSTAPGSVPPVSKEPKTIKKTPLAGVAGAVVGALIGGTVILMLYQMGYFAAVSGIVLAFCTLQGYSLLGGPHNRSSLALCVVLMLLTPLFADTVHWAMLIQDAYADYGVSLWESLSVLPMMLAEGAIDPAGYLTNLLILYGFTALGAAGVLAAAMKKK